MLASKAIVTGHYGLEETETALRMARSDPLSIKRIVAPGLPARGGRRPWGLRRRGEARGRGREQRRRAETRTR